MSDSTIPSLVASAREQVTQSDFFALGYLALSDIAYTEEGSAQKAVAGIQDAFKSGRLATYQSGTCAGYWALEWGPVATPDNGNLMYAASYRESTTQLPVFLAIAVRGTDVKAFGQGLLDQLVEDMDAEKTYPWPFLNPYSSNDQGTAAIAQGSWDGLQKLMAMQDSTQSGQPGIAKFTSDFLAQYPGLPALPVVVTGHSLGGCMTTTVAAYLYSELPAGTVIVPNSFAAPTAGNPAFASMFASMFPYGPRWVNTLDLVPKAFAGLNDIRALWNPCSVTTPLVAKGILDVLEAKMKSLTYAQAGMDRTTPGVCAQQSRFTKLADPWFNELLFQHNPITGYWNNITRNYPKVGQLAPPSVS